MAETSGAFPANKTSEFCTPKRFWKASAPASPRAPGWRRSACIARALGHGCDERDASSHDDPGFLHTTQLQASRDVVVALRAFLATYLRLEMLSLYSTGTSLETLVGMAETSGTLLTLGSRDAGAALLAFLATCPTLETFSGIARARRWTRSRTRPKRAGRCRPRRRGNSCSLVDLLRSADR